MFTETGDQKDNYDVVARASEKRRVDQPYKSILKIFKLGDEIVTLELSRDCESGGWLISASTEGTRDKTAGYASEYFDKYEDALECFNRILNKYGLEEFNGLDFGSD